MNNESAGLLCGCLESWGHSEEAEEAWTAAEIEAMFGAQTVGVLSYLWTEEADRDEGTK